MGFLSERGKQPRGFACFIKFPISQEIPPLDIVRVRERRTSLDCVPGPVEVEAQVELGNIIVDSEGEGEEDQPRLCTWSCGGGGPG